ncbi:MAG: M20 family peptidase, partial [Proteobacteria bacterium]|nr:M20 family peptidase [Pseudomonadota bacterium]
MKRLLLATLASLLIRPVMAQLSATEQELANYIDAHHEEAIELLIEVVNINSGTQNFAGVERVGRIFQTRLDALGMETEWIDGSSWNRSGHLVARNYDTSNAGPN